MSKYTVYILLKGVYNINTVLHEQINSILTAKRCIQYKYIVTLAILLKGVYNINTLLHEQIYSINTAKRCIQYKYIVTLANIQYTYC